jgi:TolB-like protein
MPEQSDSDAVGSPTPAGDAPVFISYASADTQIAEQLCAALEQAGVPCWIAPRNVRAGESYAAAIVQAINSCRLLVLVLSRRAIESAHVLREVERASSKKRPILTVRLDNTALPPELEYFLSMHQWLDATAGRLDAVLPALIAAVRGETRPRSGPPAQRRRPRWGLVGATAAALLLLVGAALALRGWLSASAGGAPAAAARAQARESGAAAKSVAVMPFADLSETHDQQYFADGLTEELIDRLAGVSGLRVPARASSFYFKGRQATLPEVAAALHVTHLLEGSVRKAGSAVRISADLVRVADDARVWSESFDRRLDDIFKVQDDIAGAVVRALKGSLLASARARPAPTANTEAYTIFLQGNAILRGGARADYLNAINYYQRAVALDPNFAPGWAAIADTSADAWAVTRSEPFAVVTGRAHAALERALALDPSGAAGYVALGRLAYFVDLDWDTATRALARALELDPGDAEAMRLRSYLAGTLGQLDAQRDFAQQAIAQDPLDFWNYFAAGLADYNAGRFADGEAAYRKALELNDRADGIRFRLAELLLARGQPAAALEEAQRESAADWRALSVPAALDALGRRAEANHMLAQAQSRYGNTHAFWIALIYAARRDGDNAFRWLERSLAQHDATPLYMPRNALQSNFAGDPRLQDFLRQMKLPR